MKKNKRFLSGFLAVLLCVTLNINPLTVITVEFLQSDFARDIGIIGDNILYLMQNPGRVSAAEATPAETPASTEEPSSGGGCSCSFSCSYNEENIKEAIVGATSSLETAISSQSNVIGQKISDQTDEFGQFILDQTDTLGQDIIAQTEILEGSIDGVKASVDKVNDTLLTTIHKDLQEIKDQIALQQHQYRVAHLYSLNNMLSNALWRPTIEEVDYAEDYAYITGQFANIYDGYWNTNVTSVNKGSAGAQRALETLGYDALIRREGVIVMGGFGQIEVNGNKTYGWVDAPGALQTESGARAWQNTQYDGYSDAYELRDRSLDKVKTLYYQELIPEKEITWLDAVTLLYKAVDQEIQSFEAFMIHDNNITPEKSPAYQNLSNPVPGYQNPKTGRYEEFTYNGYNMYMFFSRSNLVFQAKDNNGEMSDITHTDYYWNRACADGVVLRDNADKKIRGDELFILAAHIMQIYGEPELNQDEIDALLQVYGKDYPVQLGEDVADSWAYLKVRGCLEAPISYTGFVSRDQMLDLAMRIKDPDSRMDYKNIQVVLDLADVMISDGWYPVEELEYSTEAAVEMEIDYTIQTHYDYLIRKGEQMSDGRDLKFVASNGTEATDILISNEQAATHNVSLCSGTDHRISTVDGASYEGIVNIAGREYYHIRIPKDAGIGTGFKLFGIISDEDGTELASTNEYMLIPSNMIGGGIYGSWTTDGTGIKATNASFQSFDSAGLRELYKYTDCDRAKDVDIQAERRTADASDRTAIEWLLAGWDKITTPLRAEAALSQAQVYADGSGGGGGSTLKFTYKYGNNTEGIDGTFESVTEQTSTGSEFKYYKASSGNSAAARAFRLVNGTRGRFPYIMSSYDGNLLSDIIAASGMEDPQLSDSTAEFWVNAYLKLAFQNTKINDYDVGVSPAGVNGRFNTYMRYTADMPDGMPDSEFSNWSSANHVDVLYDAWLQMFTEAYCIPSNADFTGTADLFVNDKVTSSVSGLNNAKASSNWNYAVADYDDIRELVYGSSTSTAFYLYDMGNDTLQLRANNVDDTAAAKFGEYLSAGSSSTTEGGSNATVGTYEDFIQSDVFSSTVMDRSQNILISFTDLKKAGFVDPASEKPKMMSDGAYYLNTPKGVVKVNDNTKMISVGGTLYNLAGDDGSGPTIAYEDPNQGEWYFDYRCFMGVISTNVYESQDGKGTIDGSSIGCAGSVVYTMSDGKWGSSIFQSVPVNSYNFPDTPGLSDMTNLGNYTVDLIKSYVYDGEEFVDPISTSNETKVYWGDDKKGSYRMSLTSFNPTANYLHVIRQSDDGTKASVFVWYPRAAFANGFYASDGDRVGESVDSSGYNRMLGHDSANYNLQDGTYDEYDDSGNCYGDAYVDKAYQSCPKYGNKAISQLLDSVYKDVEWQVNGSVSASRLPWYDKMTIGAACNLYAFTGGGFYLSPKYVIREFPLTWDNTTGNSPGEVRQPYGFADGIGRSTTGLDSNRTGACYWLSGIGYVYNLPTVNEWSMEKYLSGEIMLPYAVNAATSGMMHIVNFNMDSYCQLTGKDGTENAPFYGAAYADDGIIKWTAVKDMSGSSTLIKAEDLKVGTVSSYVNPIAEKMNDMNDAKPFVYAPTAVYVHFGGSQNEQAGTQDMTGFVTTANTVYLGARRIQFDKMDQGNYMFYVGSRKYDPIVLNDTTFYRVHNAYNGSDVWVAIDGSIETNDVGTLNPVDVFDTYPNPVQDFFDGLGVGTLLNKIDQGSSWLILFSFKVLPMIGVIVMTILIGLSFVADARVVQKICEKTIDPVRLLTAGFRDINTWNWHRVLIPCTILYISFALFLNGNIIRVIQWCAETYGVISKWARSL